MPIPEQANEGNATNEENNTDTQTADNQLQEQPPVASTMTENNTVTETKDEPAESESKKDTDDDDSGWITPDNIQEVTAKYYGTMGAPDDGRNVGCITTDYAMQNVLLQMGLGLLSVDGYTIKTVRQYVLKCSACNKYFVPVFSADLLE